MALKLNEIRAKITEHRSRGNGRWWLSLRERAIEFGLLAAALSSVAITLGIVFILCWESVGFFAEVSLIRFLTDTQWTPNYDPPHYGILPLLSGTLVTTFVALCVALPVGTITAIYLSEFASAWVREIVKPLLELLSAIPTVVYGYFALYLVAPFMASVMKTLFDIELPSACMLTAGIVMGIMIIPYVSSLSEDAMRAVPMLLREGAYALGANKIRTAITVVFPAATSGIGAAYILGLSRAIGETMIVAIAGGMQAKLSLDPRDPAMTVTAYIVQVSQGDLPHGSIGYKTIFAAGLTLFIMTLGFNLIGHYLKKRFREAY